MGMGEISTPTYSNVGLELEQSGNQVTICNANLALEMARLKSQPEEIAIALIQLAHLHFRQGRYNQTQTLVKEVLRDAPADSPQRCDALRMLGNCAAELGDPEWAEHNYHQAIDLARQINYPYALYKCLHSLATNIYFPRGQFGLCLAAGKDALQQAQALDLGEELWFPLSDIGWVYWNTGQRTLANQIADQMQAVVTPDSLGEGFTCCLRAGQVEQGEKYLNTVIPLYDRARSIAEATGDPGLNMEVRLGLCRVYRAVKDLPAAMSWADDAVAVSERMKYRQLQGAALIERGRTRFDLGDLDGAEADLNVACTLSTQLCSNFDLTRAKLYLASVLSVSNRPESGATWQQAVKLILDYGYDFLIEQERSLVIPWIADTLNTPEPSLAHTSAALFDRLMRLPPAPLQVKTLGQYILRVGSNLKSKESLRQRRAGELLSLLLSSPGYTLSGEQVTEAMCPEKEPCAAVDFYHHAISALRRLLEPDLPDRRFPCRYLEVDDEHVTLLLPPGSEVDFLEFEKQFQNKNWEGAIRLYRGEFLPVFRYAEWTISIRQRFADLYEAAVLLLAELKLEQGDALACIDLVRQVLLHNPWQERAVELGMRGALAREDRITALQLYKRLEKVLEKDLGIAPQNELQALYIQARQRSSRK